MLSVTVPEVFQMSVALCCSTEGSKPLCSMCCSCLGAGGFVTEFQTTGQLILTVTLLQVKCIADKKRKKIQFLAVLKLNVSYCNSDYPKTSVQLCFWNYSSCHLHIIKLHYGCFSDCTVVCGVWKHLGGLSGEVYSYLFPLFLLEMAGYH